MYRPSKINTKICFFEIRHVRTKYVYFLFRLNFDIGFFIKPSQNRLCIWTISQEQFDLDCNFWGSLPFKVTTVGNSAWNSRPIKMTSKMMSYNLIANAWMIRNLKLWWLLARCVIYINRTVGSTFYIFRFGCLQATISELLVFRKFNPVFRIQNQRSCSCRLPTVITRKRWLFLWGKIILCLIYHRFSHFNLYTFSFNFYYRINCKRKQKKKCKKA